MSDLEAVDKLIETGGIEMIISEILCLFAYIACPLFLLPSRVVESDANKLRDYKYWGVSA